MMPVGGVIRRGWQRLRRNFWLSLAVDATLILAVMLAVHAWQVRDLVDGVQAPSTVLATLDDGSLRNATQAGQPGVVYFFAPWCGYCRHSIGNLDDLVAAGTIAWGTVVALDYSSRDEVDEFIRETGVDLPVLMGAQRTAADWGVRAFPSYFVIDENGLISSRSVGYSTRLGLRLRAMMAGG